MVDASKHTGEAPKCHLFHVWLTMTIISTLWSSASYQQ